MLIVFKQVIASDPGSSRRGAMSKMCARARSIVCMLGYHWAHVQLIVCFFLYLPGPYTGKAQHTLGVLGNTQQLLTS
jgi:hypothetical protein